ncbi:MAG: hypothetical protein Cpurp_11720 [Chlorogloea purpurea SAG 13.99]|jgi:hypothetical protein|nr:hypothetical protein [Chlorogloea purpurea SAG 13.99]
MEILTTMRFCFVLCLLTAVIWAVGRALKDTVAIAKQMHSIPCHNCVYFTNDYRLKCPVNPMGANTESAIDCPDYRGKA